MPDLYDLYDLNDLFHAVEWKPHDLRDLANASCGLAV